MRKREFVKKEGSGPNAMVYFKYEGDDKVRKVDSVNWKMYKLRESILDAGVDEDDLDELIALTCSNLEPGEDYEGE